MARVAFSSDKVPAPIAPFSPAVRGAQGVVYLSGTVGQDPATGRLVEGGIAAQTEQALRNLETVLEAAGKSMDEVVKVSVFLTDMRDFADMNAVYGKHFQAPYPARTTVQVAGLPLGAAVEIDLVTR